MASPIEDPARPRLALSRRTVVSVFTGLGVIAPLTTARAFGPKIAPSEVRYQTSPKGKARCDACRFWRPPASCEKVSGQVRPDAWCELFASKPGRA